MNCVEDIYEEMDLPARTEQKCDEKEIMADREREWRQLTVTSVAENGCQMTT